MKRPHTAGITLALMTAVLLGVWGLGPSVLSQQSGASLPVADFTIAPENPDINTEVVLDAGLSRASSGQITQYEWDLNGDGEFEILTQEPQIVYLFDESGTYTLVLRVTDSQGRQAMAAKTLTVRSAPVRVRRAIVTPLEPNRVPAGSAFQVTITITALQTINGLGLDEDLPQGWRASAVDSSGAAFKSAEAQWLWFQTITPGQAVKVVYNVTVPRGTAPDTYEIQGVVSSFSPRFEIAIPGDHAVRVF